MTQKQFDNYKFSIKTEVKVNGEWEIIDHLDTKEGKVFYKDGTYRFYEEIEDIRN